MRPRSKIVPQRGHRVIFRYNGNELFRGIITSQRQSDKKTMTFTAYDMGIYLSNNKDSFEYHGATAGVIFKDCCDRFGLPYDAIASTEYEIPEMAVSQRTAWDVITDALSQTWEANGKRFYVRSDHDKLALFDRSVNMVQLVLEPGANISSWQLSRSIEQTRTRIKLFSSENTVVAEAKDEELEKLIGIFQEVETVDDELNEAQIDQKAQTLLEDMRYVEQTLQTECIGDPSLIAGVAAMVKVPDVSLFSTMYVEEDSHSFESGLHTMTLRMTYKFE